MKRPSTLLEDFIYQLYSKIDIYNPNQLDMETISSRLGMTLLFMPVTSFNSDMIICIDSRKSDHEQFEDFAHELGHALLHAGNQNIMPPPYRIYLEWRANNFAAHACVPSFMLEKMELHPHDNFAIWQIQKEFKVSRNLASKRYYQFCAFPYIKSAD